MRKIATMIVKICNDESGVSSVEYALLLSFVAAGIIFGAELLSNAVENEMTDTAKCIEGTGVSC
jgi:Flp pilus assembly pilin Flp